MARQQFQFRLDGLKDLDRNLKQLPRAMAKATWRRILKKAAMPVKSDAEANAPVGPTGNLASSIAVGTRLNASQKRMVGTEPDAVTLYIGTTWPTGAHGHLQEFGTAHHAAQPFLRPAWDRNRMQVLASISDDAWDELVKAARRLARRAERGTLGKSARRQLGGR